jgi:hypothetical protein
MDRVAFHCHSLCGSWCPCTGELASAVLLLGDISLLVSYCRWLALWQWVCLRHKESHLLDCRVDGPGETFCRAPVGVVASWKLREAVHGNTMLLHGSSRNGCTQAHNMSWFSDGTSRAYIDTRHPCNRLFFLRRSCAHAMEHLREHWIHGKHDSSNAQWHALSR